MLPAKVELLPLTVIGALPKVSESVTEPAPSHKATVCPVPTPDNTEYYQFFCHSPVPVPAQFGNIIIPYNPISYCPRIRFARYLLVILLFR